MFGRYLDIHCPSISNSKSFSIRYLGVCQHLLVLLGELGDGVGEVRAQHPPQLRQLLLVTCSQSEVSMGSRDQPPPITAHHL